MFKITIVPLTNRFLIIIILLNLFLKGTDAAVELLQHPFFAKVGTYTVNYTV